MGKARVGLNVLIIALVLAACTGRFGGTPERAPANGQPLTRDVLGDLHTINPCGRRRM